MTYLPYPNDPARLAATNPIFNDNSFVRGDEQRLNNSEIWANFDGLNTELISQDTRLDTIESTYLYKGLINGGIEFNTLTDFPNLGAGFYEVNGKILKVPYTGINFTNTFFNNRQALDTNCCYLILLSTTGAPMYLMYGEGVAQASQSVTNITGTTTKTITVPTVPGSSTEEYTALISGTGSFTGSFKATRASATTFNITLSTDPGSSFSGMTVTLYYKIRTLHGTAASAGTFTNITTNLSALYTPSLGETGVSDSFALFDTDRNGFYCTLSGLTDYRVIGMVNTNNTPQVTADLIFSFKSGRNKNDNRAYVRSVASLVTNAIRWTNYEKLFGCDYEMCYNNATVGSWIVIKRPGLVSHRLQTYNSGSAVTRGLYEGLSGTLTSEYTINTINASSLSQKGDGHGGAGAISNIQNTLYVQKNSLLKPFATAVTTSDDRNRYDFVLDLD